MNNKTILIVDDESQIRKLLEINLVNQDYKVLMASTGEEGIHMAASHQPDLILLDLGLPDINGHEVLKQLKAWYMKPIIILSVQNSEFDIVKALDNGAEDYLGKPFRTGELLARIRNAMRHAGVKNNADKIQTGLLCIDLNSRTVTVNQELIKLTATEYELLTLLASNQSKVLTHQFILKQIWGPSFVEETQYLRVYIGQLRKKIEINSNDPKHIVTESGVGYRFF
jgi:two-component system KDP operon response regulator KdpE